MFKKIINCFDKAPVNLGRQRELDVAKGIFKGIRISTRPDGIDAEICGILKKYGVTAVELGAQSLDDKVLRLNERGHTAKQVEDACVMLKDFGFELGLQMMTGLYGSEDADSIETAEKIDYFREEVSKRAQMAKKVAEKFPQPFNFKKTFDN